METQFSKIFQALICTVAACTLVVFSFTQTATACDPDCAEVAPICKEDYEEVRTWKITSTPGPDKVCSDDEDYMYLSWEIWCRVPSCDTAEGNICALVETSSTVAVAGIESCSGDECAQLCGWHPCDPNVDLDSCTLLYPGEEITVTSEANPAWARLPEMDDIEQIFILFANDRQMNDYAVSFNLLNECGSCDPDWKKDDCGECGGHNEKKGCDGVCFSDKVVDKCDVCDGDGTTCDDCVEETATRRQIRKAKRVITAAKVLRDRVSQFQKIAEECGGVVNATDYEKAKKIFRKMKRLLTTKILKTILVCDNSVCSSSSTRGTKRRLRRLNIKLTLLAKKAKIHAVGVCNSTHDPNDHRANTDDYKDDVINTIKKLPGQKTDCV